VKGDNPLHRARMARGLELAEIARRTCLSPQVVQKIDSGRFDELPGGLYARSYIRAFAGAVDLDAEEALGSIADQLPSIGDPLPVLHDVAERKRPSWTGTLLPLAQAVGTRLAACAAPVSRIRQWPGWTRGGEHSLGARLHGAVARGVRSAEAVRHLGTSASAGRRVAAIAVDVAVLILLHVLLVQLTVWTTGARPETIRDAAGIGVTAVWALLVVQYYVLLGGVGGRTPGAWLFGLRHPARAPRAQPLGLRAILYRTVVY
jgi:transcriptional regulator with XRE-family HTH domain